MTTQTASLRTKMAAGLAVAAVLGLTSCTGAGGDEARPGESASAQGVRPQASPTSGPGESSAGTPSVSASASASVAKVDANDASVAELTAALEAAGVPDAARWAGDIERNRPYSGTGDLARLRAELDRSNVDDATFAKIVSVLQL